MRSEEICFTWHSSWTLGHICGENMGKDLLRPSGVRDTKENTTEPKEELVIAKNLDPQIEEIVEGSMVGNDTHENDNGVTQVLRKEFPTMLKPKEHLDLLRHEEKHDHELPLLESPLKAQGMDMDALIWHSSFGKANNEVQADEWTSTVATRLPDDSH